MHRNSERAIPVQGEAGSAYVRFLHTVPTVPPVDIYANDKLIKSNLRYGEASDFYRLDSGLENFTVYRAGTNEELIGIIPSILPDKSAFTIAGIGVPEKLGILQIPETAQPKSTNNYSFLRFVNLSSDVPPLNLSLQNGPTIFENVGFKGYSIYHRMAPGDYTINLTSASSGLDIYNDINVRLEPGKLYTLYTIGYDVNNIKRGTVLLNDDLVIANSGAV
jgi:hypothetical protein